ncbi:FliM/FliN family flagellar motor switch protein [uncultured Sulfitobacter sp.]|uniref:FliM/FliN family flagellar motor switch protein n=1 Tax=uncultured Sulfitobacter sp. TaxID=191468 RepID=UPI0026040FDD|nr:FliM/FliN family flagellar motor switch protein [uncultured Sulfitobacter sp.]
MDEPEHDVADADQEQMIPAGSEPVPKDPKQKAAADTDAKSMDAIFGVKLNVRVVLGTSRMQISELLNLTKGSVIELDRRVGEPVEIMINDRTVARGDLVRVQEDMLGVALREIIKDFVSES